MTPMEQIKDIILSAEECHCIISSTITYKETTLHYINSNKILYYTLLRYGDFAFLRDGLNRIT